MLKTTIIVLLMAFASEVALAQSTCSLIAPGDARIRHDVQLLDDRGRIRLPTSSWPLATQDLRQSLAGIDDSSLAPAERAAYERLRKATACSTRPSVIEIRYGATGATNPRVVRSFESTPRDNGAVGSELAWKSGRMFGYIAGQVIANPGDGETVRPDGTLVGASFGNWLLTAGWQDKWWGPGHDGSMILSTNARPLPALTMQRNRSTAFSSPWLHWIGPWNLTAFMAYMDDERVIDDTLLAGMRFVFVPLQGLEIGLSRTAQWCGRGRPCDGSTFVDLLLGNDNRGVNIDSDDEPGNQLGGVDLRWSLPDPVPAAVYLQWTAEDTRRGGPEIGSWLRLAGVEYAATFGANSLRTHFEIAETSCRDGGAGFSDLVPNCAYEHGIYRSGYRYKDRSIGHAMDGDGLSYSAGATLVQSRGQAWNVLLRRMKINRAGAPNDRHSLSAIPLDLTDVQVSYSHELKRGVIRAAIGVVRTDNRSFDSTDNELTGFLQWQSY